MYATRSSDVAESGLDGHTLKCPLSPLVRETICTVDMSSLSLSRLKKRSLPSVRHISL